MKRALIVITLAVAASAQVKTWNPLPGRLWGGLGLVEKTFYVQGIFDGLVAASKAVDPSSQCPPTILSATSDAFFPGDYVPEIDKVYADRDNLVVPVPYVYAYCTEKLRGTHTKAELEQHLMELRKQFAAFPNRQQE